MAATALLGLATLVGCSGSMMPADGGMPMADGSVPTDVAGSCDGGGSGCRDVVDAACAAPDADVLVCATSVQAMCTGARTAVNVAAPRVAMACAAAVGMPTNDAPAAGFPVGDTVVTFRAGGTGGAVHTCQTAVRVTDLGAPEISCPAPSVVVRASPTQEVVIPAAQVVDLCDPAPSVRTTPATITARGRTSVRYQATDASMRSSECTADVEVLDAFPVTDLRVLAGRLVAAAETSITIGWEPRGSNDTTAYRLERSPTSSGPWTAVALVNAPATEATDPRIDVARGYYRVVSVVRGLDGGVSSAILAHAIRPGFYDLRGQTVPTVPFATTLYGVVRRPADLTGGPFPLVLLLHGNHGNCRPLSAAMDDACSTTTDHDCHATGYTTTPNAEGLTYLAETLAAHGVIAVTISGNALNCRDDYILPRAQLLIEHLRRWRGWNETAGAPFGSLFVGAVATDRIGLVGHSRGGEAVSHVPALLDATPERAIALRSVFAIAPTDYHDPRPSGVAYAVLVPACDGDVASLDGIQIYDRAVDSVDANPSAQVFFVGANHNYFSTEWRFDDNRLRRTCDAPMLVGETAQRGMLEATLSSWMDSTLGTAVQPEPFVRADDALPRSIAGHAGAAIDLRWSYSAASTTAIDDFEGTAAPLTNRLSGMNAFTGFSASTLCRRAACDTAFPHLENGLILSWDTGTPRATMDLGRLDASMASTLSFRVASRASALNTGRTDQDFTIRVTDTGGHVAQLRLSEIRSVAHFYPTRTPRTVLQTVRVPIARLTTLMPSFDPSSLARFEVEMGISLYPTGSVVVTDVELAR